MVREYLRDGKVAHVMQIWREGIVIPCKEQGINYPCWADFCNYFSKLKRIPEENDPNNRLVILAKIEEAPDITGQPIFTVDQRGRVLSGRVRRYYRINMDLLEHPGWRNPLKTLYPDIYGR